MARYNSLCRLGLSAACLTLAGPGHAALVIVAGDLEGDRATITLGQVHERRDAAPDGGHGPYLLVILDRDGKEIASQGFAAVTIVSCGVGRPCQESQGFVQRVPLSAEACGRMARVRVVRDGKVLGEADTRDWTRHPEPAGETRAEAR